MSSRLLKGVNCASLSTGGQSVEPGGLHYNQDSGLLERLLEGQQPRAVSLLSQRAGIEDVKGLRSILSRPCSSSPCGQEEEAEFTSCSDALSSFPHWHI